MNENATTIDRGQLLQVMQATAPCTGDDFFHHFTVALSRAAGTRWAFVVELLIDTQKVRIVSCSQDEEDLGVWAQTIAATLGVETIAQGRSAYEDNLDVLFPDEP